MTGLEAPLLKAGTSAVSAGARAWARSKRADLAANMSLLELALASPGLGLMPQRRLRRQLEELAESIADHVGRVAEFETSLDDEERTAAILAVADAFETTDLTDAGLFSTNLSERDLCDHVRITHASKFETYTLNAAGARLYEVLLTEISAHLLNATKVLPEYGSRALTESLRRDSVIIDNMREILDRLPRRQATRDGLSDDDDFELTYRRELARRLDNIQLFGIPTYSGAAPLRYPLSIAYVNLSLVAQKGEDVDEELAASLGDNGSQVDSQLVLSKSHRHFIRGDAGTGKTTLLQYMAVNSAQRTFRGSLSSWNTTLPLFVPLRPYAGAELPRPENFIDQSLPELADTMPVGWIHRALTRGRVLLLIDGVDELPDARRDEVYDWLLGLTETFPRSKFLVTARPTAAPANWLSTLAFSSTSVEPMASVQIRALVERWHDAVSKSLIDFDREAVLSYRRDVLRAIDSRPEVRALASNPLVCVMCCALHYDRKGSMPSDRLSLYRLALEMMLERRDAERKLTDTSVQIGFDDKVSILQAIAFWLTLNGLVDATVEQVLARVESVVSRSPQISSSARDVMKSLLQRSGVLREPVAGKVDFIHKTFMEYLAAKQAVEDECIPLVVSNAHLDAWREIAILAAGLARPREQQALLATLLDESERCEPERRDKLRATAVAALETARQVDQETYNRVLACASDFIPPRDRATARMLALVGPHSVRMLPAETSDLSEAQATAIVYAGGLIGGTTGLQLLSRFRGDARLPVVTELVAAWPYFDAVEFAEIVLSHLVFPDGRIELEELSGVRGLSAMPNVKTVHLDMPRFAQLEQASTIAHLRTLSIESSDDIGDLSGLAQFAELEVLNVVNSRPSRWPDWHEMRKLHSVRLSISCSVQDLVGLQAAPRLRRLAFGGGGYHWEYVAPNLLRLSGLRSLELDKIRRIKSFEDLPALSELQELSGLYLPELQDIRGLEGLLSLRRLRLVGCDALRLPSSGAPVTSVTDLHVENCRNLTLDAIRTTFPNVDNVWFDNIEESGLDLAAPSNSTASTAIWRHGRGSTADSGSTPFMAQTGSEGSWSSPWRLADLN